jgi:hypothetical protein
MIILKKLRSIEKGEPHLSVAMVSLSRLRWERGGGRRGEPSFSEFAEVSDCWKRGISLESKNVSGMEGKISGSGPATADLKVQNISEHIFNDGPRGHGNCKVKWSFMRLSLS